MHYLQLIRYKNLILLALMQLVFRFGFLKQNDIPLSLTNWQYYLLVLATVLIAAGGYVINDIFDQDTDSINKPKKLIVGKSITEAKAYNFYAALTIAGVSIGFYLSNVIEKPSFATLFILIAALLYFYATTLKQIALVGNIAVALLLGFSVIIIGIFDLYPATYDGNQEQMATYFSILFDYAKFAFSINLIREIVKDIEDYEGDNAVELKTLPVIFGIKKTAIASAILLLIPILYLLYYTNTYLMQNNLYYGTIYLLVFAIAPLLFCAVQLFTANEKKHFHLISTLLKWIIFFGIFSIMVITLNIKNNA
jgi:4-hydroxybenzoate polyprenyltransferase